MMQLHRTGRILRRTAIQALPAVAGVVTLNFILLMLMPGDVVDTLAMEAGSGDAEIMKALREQLGLNLPLLERLWAYLSGLARLDLGMSARFNEPVLNLIMARLPDTLLLLMSALLLAIVLGILVGWAMAAFAGSWLDRALSVLVLLAYSMPAFWLGLMAIVLLSVNLGWLPSGGNMTVGANLSGWALFTDRLHHIIMPALTLALFYAAIYARLMRATMLEVRQQDFIRTAAAKGLHPAVLQLRHAIPNALIPVTTMAGIHLSGMFGGAMVIETVFGWPGMGRLAMDSMLARDSSVLLGILLLSSMVVIIANVLVDLFQAWLDPRIQMD